MNQDQLNVLNEAWQKYGKAPQMDMLVEECAELIQAVNKERRKPGFVSENHLAEEIADVEIMLHQVKSGLGLNEQVEAWKEGKVKRLAERIKS